MDARGGRYGSTPLFAACWRGNYETAELLLQAGADPYLVDNSSALTIFSLHKSTQFSRLLANLAKRSGDMTIGHDVDPQPNAVQYADSRPDADQIPELIAWGNDAKGDEGCGNEICGHIEGQGTTMELFAISTLIEPTLEGFGK